ncbi:MAG: hypothetical protein GF329_06480 [Candidatus Lokiarchaeota archaeon]|nr:hypothetical protein [Candidatus Lokiarchaeota archaeon]
MKDINEFLESYRNLKTKINDFRSAYDLKKGPSELELLLDKKTKDNSQNESSLPDHRLIKVKIDRFEEELSDIKKDLFSFLIEYIKKIRNTFPDLDDQNIELSIENKMQLDKEYWKFISECFANTFPLEIFGCIFNNDKIQILDTEKYQESVNRSLNLLSFLAKVESGYQEENKIVKMNWGLLMGPRIKKNFYAKIIKEIGISKSLNIEAFSEKNDIKMDKIEGNINELSSFSSNLGLSFPVLKKQEKEPSTYVFTCYGKYLWEKFGIK